MTEQQDGESGRDGGIKVEQKPQSSPEGRWRWRTTVPVHSSSLENQSVDRLHAAVAMPPLPPCGGALNPPRWNVTLAGRTRSEEDRARRLHTIGCVIHGYTALRPLPLNVVSISGYFIHELPYE